MKTQRQDIRQELEALGATHLHQWQGQELGARLSEDRLRQLAEDAQAMATAEPTIRAIRSSRSFDWRWAAAAVIMLLVAVAVWVLPVRQTVGELPVTALEELDEATILAYVEANITDFEWELLERELGSGEMDFEAASSIPDTAIENFLETEEDWWTSDY